VQVTPSAIISIPLPADAADAYRPGDPDAPILDEYPGELVVAYTVGPPYGERLVSAGDLDALDLSLRALRRSAAANLADVWDSLADQVDGEIVVGAPARDVLFLTGSGSQAGLEKIHRACERVFFAGHANLLSRHLLIRRDGGWHRF
jgi:uncharacterized protein YtpQ (UPF0354 family)